MINTLTRTLAAGAVLALANVVTADPLTPDSDRVQADQAVDSGHAPGAAPALRWSAEVDRRPDTTALIITDNVSGTRYRLSDFENAGMVHAHWIGTNQLEIDFPDHERILEVRLSESQTTPTFHLMTSQFNVGGATRVDYYSPPLVARLDRRPSAPERDSH